MSVASVSTGGVVSRTVTIVSAVPVAPFESVTRRPIACDPSGSVTLRTSPVPRDACVGRPRSRNHSNDTMSSFAPDVESGSVEPEPSSEIPPPA